MEVAEDMFILLVLFAVLCIASAAVHIYVCYKQEGYSYPSWLVYVIDIALPFLALGVVVWLLLIQNGIV